jgi:hypothetical protein
MKLSFLLYFFLISFTTLLQGAISNIAINWQFAWVTFLGECEGNIES